jgi:hypothetical protein
VGIKSIEPCSDPWIKLPDAIQGYSYNVGPKMRSVRRSLLRNEQSSRKANRTRTRSPAEITFSLGPEELQMYRKATAL